MCGLVGVAGSWTLKNEKAFQELLVMSSLRGKDSTGAIFANDSGVCKTIKSTDDPIKFLSSVGFNSINKSAWDLYMGHTRWATKGKINNRNAHPFEHGKIVGMHNGTILNHKELDPKGSFDTDSEALIYLISKIGIKEMWSQMYGAAALTWFNKDDNTIHFARNNDRTLFFIKTKSGDILWASEMWMLDAIAERNSIEMDGRFFFEPNKHYSFVLESVNNKTVVRSTDISVLEERKFTSYRSQHYSIYDQGGVKEDWRLEGNYKDQGSLWDRDKDIPFVNDPPAIVPKQTSNVVIGEKITQLVGGKRYGFNLEKCNWIIQNDKRHFLRLGLSLTKNKVLKAVTSLYTDITPSKLIKVFDADYGDYSNVILVGTVIGSSSKDGIKTWIVDHKDITPVFPNNATRLVGGIEMTPPDFHKNFKECHMCKSKVEFDDTETVFSTDCNRVACGTCVSELEKDGTTPEQIQQLLGA